MLKYPFSISKEVIIITLLLFSFLIINLVTASRFPAVWIDEALFADPATNLYFGNGFTSTAWWTGSRNEFWSGNAPLYSFILYQWICLFKFSILSVRSLNYVLIVISTLMIWLSLVRLKLVNLSWHRIIFVAVLLLNSAITFNYRSVRYDCLTISLTAAAFFIYSIQLIWLRCVLLTCIAILFPIAGFQLIAFTFFLCCLLLVFIRRRFLNETISLTIGIFIGIGFLNFIYSTNGVWLTFIEAINSYRSHGILTMIRKIIHIPEIFLQESSFLLLLILALIVTVNKIGIASFKLYSVLSFGLIVSISIPILLSLTSQFPGYYTWMAFIPLLICIFSQLSEFSKTNNNYLMRLLVPTLIVIICLTGLPKSLASAAFEWNKRDYTQVENLIEMSVRKNDKVYSDFTAFYALKKKGIPVVFPTYLWRKLTPEEKQEISVIIFDPRITDTGTSKRPAWNPDLDLVTGKLGGKWFNTGYKIGSQEQENTSGHGLDFNKYNLMVLRKENK